MALAPTYRLLWGIPGRSNALNIAARLGLEPSIVQAARARLGAERARVDASVLRLEHLRRHVEGDQYIVTWLGLGLVL